MIRGRRRDERGAAIVEFALVLPLLLVLVSSIVDFGLYLFIDHTIQFATREGVRSALARPTVSDASGDPLDREESIVKTIQDEAAIAIDPSQLQISIFPVAASHGDPVDREHTRDARNPGATMRVTTQYSYAFVTPLLGALLAHGRLPVIAQATYWSEGFRGRTSSAAWCGRRAAPPGAHHAMMW